jgi:hypothetical protein
MARKPKSGVKSSINPQREEFTEIRAKLLHGHREWKMIRLRELIREHETQLGSPLADNYLSERAAAKAEIARAKRYVLLDEIDALWRDKAAGFERAVLDGDATWFERQAKAIRSGDTRSETDKARDAFEAAVARELEMWFEPSGKRAGVTAQQVLDALRQRKVGRYLFVEDPLQPGVGCRFESKRRAREAISRIAELYGWKLADETDATD